tara:strand:- start:10070 stop:13387 length:3318 start_codon:yes stop_codon:yes gene_type:complete
MAKVFRIHQGGQIKTGWFESSKIGPNDLNTIIADENHIASSIPSPFARIDLVKSAFRWVANNKLDGDSAQHKLVSDSLDVGQLFFLSQNSEYQSKIKIIEWDPNTAFDKFRKTTHSSLFDSLEVYWKRDGGDDGIYNFNLVDKLYLIFYNNKLVGSTSPSTLFIPAPDASSEYLEMDIWRGDDKLFDSKYASLANREFSYTKYIFSLSKTQAFTANFRANDKNEFFEYLNNVRNNLSSAKREEIELLNDTSYSDYQPCFTSESIDNEVSIAGIKLGLFNESQKDIRKESDFVIRSTISKEKPLVLPQTRFNKPWRYTSSDNIWLPDIMEGKIPSKNTKTGEKSILPVDQSNYPWLTAGNFFEEKLITLPYSIDNAHFNTKGPSKHLLPLTETFFDFFDINDVPDLLKFKELSSGTMQFNLKIPVGVNEHIEFIHNYAKEEQLICPIYLSMTPQSISDETKTESILGFAIDILEKRHKKVSLSAFSMGKAIDLSNAVTRDDGIVKGSQWFSRVYKSLEKIDRINISLDGASGVIIPKERKFREEISKLRFAIDFGTTNTHIEISKDNQPPKALEITNSDPILLSLLDKKNKDTGETEKEFNTRFEREQIPFTIGENEQVNFPLRTALSYNAEIDFTKPLSSFQHSNNFLFYEKMGLLRSQKLKTDLKWSNYNDPKDEILVELYIEYLLRLILFNSITLGCKPQNVEVTWFYPVSMDQSELKILTEIWENKYKAIFNSENIDNLVRIPESVAPYLHYRSTNAGLSMSIDIGGGSSDIAVFNEDQSKPHYITSFKFAGNSIFGDAYIGTKYAGNADSNGFVQGFKDGVKNVLKGHLTYDSIFKTILEDTKNSSDFSSFLFSLEKAKDNSFNYTRELQKHPKLKLPFLVFYGAIIYYAAKIQKHSGGDVPQHFLFSGTAAKSINILDSKSNEYREILKLIKYIFGKVYDQDLDNRAISIVLNTEPKEVTCKGGLNVKLGEQLDENKVLFWLGGHSGTDITLDKNEDLSKTPKYREVDDSLSLEIEQSINEFYLLFDEYIDSIKLEATFGIHYDAYDVFKEHRSSHISDYLKRGLESYHKKKENHIEETLFFYPLTGVMNKLAFELSKIN